MVYYEQENFRKDGQYHEKNHSLCSSRLFVCRDHDASGDTGASKRVPSIAALVDPLLSGDSGNQRAGRCLDQAGKTGSCNCTVRNTLTGGFGSRVFYGKAAHRVMMSRQMTGVCRQNDAIEMTATKRGCFMLYCFYHAFGGDAAEQRSRPGGTP